MGKAQTQTQNIKMIGQVLWKPSQGNLEARVNRAYITNSYQYPYVSVFDVVLSLHEPMASRLDALVLIQVFITSISFRKILP